MPIQPNHSENQPKRFEIVNEENNTATQGTASTASAVTPAAKRDTTKKAEIETSRTFRIVERKDFSIAPAGVFNATLISLAFIGNYTREFTKNNKVTSRKYEMVGLTYVFIDLNTGQMAEIFSECILSYVPDSRLHGHINALTGNDGLREGAGLKELIGKTAKITIIHRPNADGDKTYANISKVDVVDKKLSIEKVEKARFFYFDILGDMGKIESLNNKHRWLIENKSHEYGGSSSSASGV